MHFGVRFDFIVAQSIFSHAGPDIVATALRGFRQSLANDGVILATFIPPETLGIPEQTEPGWSPEETEAYLRRFHYRFGPEDLAGLERFETLLREHDLMASD